MLVMTDKVVGTRKSRYLDLSWAWSWNALGLRRRSVAGVREACDGSKTTASADWVRDCCLL